MYNFNKTYLQL